MKYKMMMRNTKRFSNAIRNNVILTLMCQALLLVIDVSGQDASIKLDQGTVVGVTIFFFSNGSWHFLLLFDLISS